MTREEGDVVGRKQRKDVWEKNEGFLFRCVGPSGNSVLDTKITEADVCLPSWWFALVLVVPSQNGISRVGKLAAHQRSFVATGPLPANDSVFRIYKTEIFLQKLVEGLSKGLLNLYVGGEYFRITSRLKASNKGSRRSRRTASKEGTRPAV